MAHNPGRSKLEAEQRKEADRIARLKREEEHRRQLYADRIMRLFKARLRAKRYPSFWPTFRTVFDSSLPWLTVQCPACASVWEVDLRMFMRHPNAAISSVLPQIRCTRCPGAQYPYPLDIKATKTDLYNWRLDPKYAHSYAGKRRTWPWES